MSAQNQSAAQNQGTALVHKLNTALNAFGTTEDVMNALRNSIYPGAKDESIGMVLSYCRAANLDPMQKPVHIVPMSVKKPGTRDQYEMRDVIMPGIGLYRTNAVRTDQYLGMSEPEYGPDVTKMLGNIELTFPLWCKVTVKRLMSNGMTAEFTAKEFWVENYATKGRDTEVPNEMWKKRPYGQLGKCAEAQALRKAFPELGSQQTAEEMEGKTLDTAEEMPVVGSSSTSAAGASQPSGGLNGELKQRAAARQSTNQGKASTPPDTAKECTDTPANVSPASPPAPKEAGGEFVTIESVCAAFDGCKDATEAAEVMNTLAVKLASEEKTLAKDKFRDTISRLNKTTHAGKPEAAQDMFGDN